MAGVVLATGIVELIPSLRGSQATIANELSRVDTNKVGQKLGKNLGNGVAGAFRKIAAPAIAAAAGLGISNLAKEAVSSYSELEDSTAAAGVIFGKEMTGIVKQSKTAARELGLTQQQVINSANTYGTYGKAAGLAGEDLAKFSSDFTTLAADLASFKGTSTEQAIDAIGSALRGEAEPIRTYGVLLDDASMRQKALELGIISTTKDALTPQQKILAAQALIFEQTADAQGDYARTSQSTANIEKTRAALAENLAAKVGQVLAPAFTKARLASIDAMVGIDGLLDRVIAFQTGLAEGATTPQLVKSLGLDPSQGFGLAVNEGIGGIFAFANAWKYNDGEVTSSGFPGWMEKAAYTIRQGVDSIKEAGADLLGGDFSAVGPLFESILAVAKPAGPLLVEVGGAVGELSGSLGELVAGALPLAIPLIEGATGVMTYLAENTGVLAVVIGGLAAAWVAYKAAQALANVGLLLSVPATVANAIANYQLAAAIRAANASSTLQAGAARGATTAMFKSAAATGGAAAANGVYAGTATGASVATRLLGAAVRALPFVGLAALIAGAIAGLVWFFTETELGKEIVANVWSFIQGAIGGVVDWFTGTALPAIGGFLGAVGGFFTGLYNDYVAPAIGGVTGVVGGVVSFFQTSVLPPVTTVVTAIGSAFSGFYNGVIVPVFGGIATVVGGFWLFFRGIGQILISLLVNVIAPAFMNFWNGVIAPVFTWIGEKIGAWWAAAGIVFGLAVGFVRDTLGGAFTWFWTSVISPVFTWIGDTIGTAIDFWTFTFGIIGDYLHVTLGPAFTWLQDNVIDPVFNGISSVIGTVWETGIKPVFDTISKVVEEDLPAAFEGGIGFIEDIWNGLLEVLKAPVRWAVNDVINGGIIKAFNTVAGWLPDVDPLPDVALPAGFYQGGRTGGNDPREVRGVVHGQEVVIPHGATAKIDRDAPGLLDQLVAGQLPAALGNPALAGYLWTPFQDQIRRSGILSLTSVGNHAGNSAWAPGPAAAAWNGITSGLTVELNTGRGAEGYYSAVGNSPYFNPNTLGYAWAHSGGIILNAAQPTSPAMRRAVMIHEIGHVLGLPHTNAASIMQPTLGNYYNPTAFDYANIAALYPGMSGGRTPAAAGDEGGGFVDWIADLFNVDDILAAITGDTFAADLIRGVGQKLVDTVIDVVTGFFGGGATAPTPGGGTPGVAPMLFDGGGFLPYTGEDAIAVQHKRRDPDAVLTGNQWRDVRSIVADRADPERMENNFYGADFDQAEEIVEQLNYAVVRKRRGGANNRKRIPV